MSVRNTMPNPGERLLTPTPSHFSAIQGALNRITLLVLALLTACDKPEQKKEEWSKQSPAQSRTLLTEPAMSDTLRQHAEKVGLSNDLKILEDARVPILGQAMEMLDSTTVALENTKGFTEREVDLLNASNRFGQWASVLNIGSESRVHQNHLANLFQQASAAVRHANEDNTPENVQGDNPEFVQEFFEEIADLHDLRSARHHILAAP